MLITESDSVITLTSVFYRLKNVTVCKWSTHLGIFRFSCKFLIFYIMPSKITGRNTLWIGQKLFACGSKPYYYLNNGVSKKKKKSIFSHIFLAFLGPLK
jgi:hypothetical protein